MGGSEPVKSWTINELEREIIGSWYTSACYESQRVVDSDVNTEEVRQAEIALIRRLGFTGLFGGTIDEEVEERLACLEEEE